MKEGRQRGLDGERDTGEEREEINEGERDRLTVRGRKKNVDKQAGE